MPDTYQFKISETCKNCIVRPCCNEMCRDRVIEMFHAMPEMTSNDSIWQKQYNQRVKAFTVRVDSNAS